ncbi:MAG: ABC transporter ATP-binding protein/permease [Erysipelotrichaceae bacterium]|nr:ABC transporter ATP-binding protein/permease [Erysipelotrichaceae bacterium]
MLQIKNVSKQYKTGELVQIALDNVSLNLRDNEFVSILGPSGSGKTTLLNIIGGLDRYDSGDLIINNVSTKDYKDRDWDSYRNHTIGFVFQSYNLIPHQSVLSNVELALTIGGISKKERRERALAALDEVGLKDQAHKRPNQMSGGQMQRVAIARALVNNPDILLADEPTGALDTQTSVQVMELLKEVAKDRLVVMVTHNPELAEEYSTRIVKLRDGKIIDDSDPFVVESDEAATYKNLGKASMAFTTALSLSFNNLLTKKGRTILTAFAGSIGIIGIALILALSTGFQNYIDKIQEDTLTSYPLTIYADTADTTSALLSMVANRQEDLSETDIVKENQFISTMMSSVGKNDLTTFKKHLEEDKSNVDTMVEKIHYTYSVQPNIYTKDVTGEYTQVNPSTMMNTLMGQSNMMQQAATSIFYEMIDDEAIYDSYDVLSGRWPKAYDEAIIVLSEPNGIPDILVYSLGLRDVNELKDMVSKIMAGEAVENTNEPLRLTYDQLLGLDFRLVYASDTYKYNDKYDIYESMVDDKDFMAKLYNKSHKLNIVGVVCAKEDSNSMSLQSGVAYTRALTEHVMNQAKNQEIVKKQLLNKDINVFSGKRFDDDSKESGLDFEDMISIDTDKLSKAFGSDVDASAIQSMTTGYMSEISGAITTDTTGATTLFTDNLKKIAKGMFVDYLTKNDPNGTGMAMIQLANVETVVDTYLATEEVKAMLLDMETQYVIPQDTYISVYKPLLVGMLQAYIQTSGSDTAMIVEMAIDPLVESFTSQAMVQATASKMGTGMTEAKMQATVLTKVGELTGKLVETMSSAMQVDPNMIASAFTFDLSEEELGRLMSTMSSVSADKTAYTNLLSLGYQHVDEPTSVSFYFDSFDNKELFIDYLDAYNEEMKAIDEEKELSYSDITGLLMSGVKTIVDSVSYVLIAFVSISLIVSSIMIGIITYISVLERTKEIGVLRAIGASKKNISSIFNAETFIVGLISGVLGIGVTLLLIPPINSFIHAVADNPDINAVLPTPAAIILVVLSVVLTLLSGLIPSRQAAKKDPVLALRSE